MANEQQAPNSPTRPTRRHTIDVNTSSVLPRFDLIFPTYSRDRRLSSITSTVPPETILAGISTNASFSTAQQNSSSTEQASNRQGRQTGTKDIFYLTILSKQQMLFFVLLRNQ